ncbi:hypothetical protein Tco_0875069 [Tanacetum coccineum]|uniref:Uncharacterized protein n=1 Tax=Tanacetum coccineum TaxID=301880 RepID=A0ABQ5BRF7_9ASTR
MSEITKLKIPPPLHILPSHVLNHKIPILKKGEYDVWAMKMEHYLAHTDYPLWEVIKGLHVIKRGKSKGTTLLLAVPRRSPSNSFTRDTMQRCGDSGQSTQKMNKIMLDGLETSSGSDTEAIILKLNGKLKHNCCSSTRVNLDSSEPTVNEPKVVSQPKVWSDAPIIEEYESDNEDEHVSLLTEEQKTPSFANQQVKTPRDCDFHEKRMDKQAELNNRMSKKSNQREIRPIWNNIQRVNHKNQFVPTTVLTRTSKILVNTARTSGTNNVSTARHNFNSQAVLTNAARKISTVKPFVDRGLSTQIFTEKRVVDSGCSRHMKWKQGLPCPQEANQNAGTEDIIDAGDSKKEAESAQDYFVLPIWSSYSSTVKRSTTKDAGEAPTKNPDLKTDEKSVDKEDQYTIETQKPLVKDEEASDACSRFQSELSPRPSPSTHILDSIPESSGGNHGGQSSSDKFTFHGYEVEADQEAKAAQNPNLLLHTTEPWLMELFSTDRPKVNTDKEKDSTVSPNEGTDDRTDGRSATPTTPTTTPTMFGDDETIAQVLLNMSQAKAVSREKEKGVELKDVEETERPRPTSTRSLLTLKPLPKIDPKDKGKKKIEEEDESDTESEGIPEAEKKFKQLARDEEMARKVQEDWEAEEEVKKLAEEEAIKTALSNEYDFIQARIEADRLLALRLQDEEREKFTVEERAKFLHDTIAAQRRFLAEQRAIAIRNKPPTRTQLRNQMMTYLKHVGNKKHSDLKNKTFEEIQALYEKVKRFDESFTAVGSTEDERKIKEMNEGAKDLEQKRLKKKVAKETPKTEDTAKVPAKVDVIEQGTKKRKGGHMKMLARKRKRSQSDVDSDDEHRKCLKIVTFKGTMDSEVMERKSVITRLNKVISPDGDYLVIYRANGNFRAFNCLLEVLHIFDRQDLFHLYDLVMEQYSEITLEGIELILWGDLKIMMESSQEENDQSDLWDDQQDWEIVTWMLDLGLEVERESTAALDLIRFIKQQIDEN